MLPLSRVRQFEKGEQEHVTPMLYRSLAPVYDLRISVHNLLSFQELRANKQLRGRALSQLLLADEKPGFDRAVSHVWMRCWPDAAKSRFDFIDLNAHDLHGSSRVFCRVFTYKNREGYLYNLVAPSFPGRVSVQLMQNFMALYEVPALLFSDVSTSFGCKNDSCENKGALHSLHMAKVLMEGKSWYVAKGAARQVTHHTFPHLYEVEYVHDEYENEVGLPAIDYDTYKTNLMRSRFSAFSTDQAYNAACNYLKELKVSEFVAALYQAELIGQADELQSAVRRWKIAEDVTLGQVLQEAEARGLQARAPTDDSHKRMHTLRSLFVSNKDLFFSEKMIKFFRENSGKTSLQGLMLLFFALTGFYKLAKEINVPKERMAETATSVLRPDEKKKIIENLTGNFKKSFLEMMGAPRGTPISAKIQARTTHEDRREWAENEEEVDHDEPVFQEAILYFLSLNVQHIRAVCPAIVQEFEAVYKKPSRNCTFMAHMQEKYDENAYNAFWFSLLEKAMENLCKISVELFEQHRKGKSLDKDNCHFLFVVAKHLVRRAEFFQFRLD